MAMSEFWTSIKNNEARIISQFEIAWAELNQGLPDKKRGLEILGILWQHSHLKILQNIPQYTRFYPTKQGNAKRLVTAPHLWWVDHATAGINGWGTLRWFSSELQLHSVPCKTKEEADKLAKRKKGTVVPSATTEVGAGEGAGAAGVKYIVRWKGFAEAVTHFVVFPDGSPFYILDIWDGCWGEPKRNADAIQIEMVNPLVVHRAKNGVDWNYWGGVVSESILRTQRPVKLDRPFRGAEWMVPYTQEQVIANIKLKRLCYAVTDKKMARSRMSQHTDWNPRKFDMGPLWPAEAINDAAFQNFPIDSYMFIPAGIVSGNVTPVTPRQAATPSWPQEFEKKKQEAADPVIEHDYFPTDPLDPRLQQVCLAPGVDPTPEFFALNISSEKK